MKKLLFLLLLSPSVVFGQTSILKQSTATQIEIIASGLSTLAYTNTGGSANANLTITLTKAADSALPAFSSWTPTTRGGGTHDCDVTIAGKSAWTCELTATDTDTQGRTVVCIKNPNVAVENCNEYVVVASASHAANVAGSLADGTAILTAIGLLDTLPKGVAYADYPVFMRRSGTAATGVTGATVSCQFAKSNGSGFAAFTSTGISNITEVANGWYEIDLDNTVIGNTTIIRCTSTGGSGASDAFQQTIYSQR